MPLCDCVMKGLIETDADMLSCRKQSPEWRSALPFVVVQSQSCLTLRNPMNCSVLGFPSVFGDPCVIEVSGAHVEPLWPRFGKRPLELCGSACLDFINTMTSFLGKIRLLSGLWLRHVFDKGRENLAPELSEVWLSWMSLKWKVFCFKRGFLICSSLSNIFPQLEPWHNPLIFIICLQIAFK